MEISQPDRRRAWILLSELFIDTDHRTEDLRALGRALSNLGTSPDEMERILREEVAPVCGRWMLYSSPVGPWPAFDEDDLVTNINQYVQTPWHGRRPLLAPFTLWLLAGVRGDWRAVKLAMQTYRSASAHNGT